MATTASPTPPTGVDLAEKLATFSEPWQPRVVGQFNGHDLMVAKLKGEFTWHQHDDTDDCPVAEEGAEVLLIEREGTPNTGDVETAAVRREI
ncbi:MAG: hypothetical protein K8R60_17810 [Burkholderiales bacterium]|nr:hypothetical protein [Burkholderiales bacterium]